MIEWPDFQDDWGRIIPIYAGGLSIDSSGFAVGERALGIRRNKMADLNEKPTQVAKDTVVSLGYTLRVDGVVVDVHATRTRPAGCFVGEVLPAVAAPRGGGRGDRYRREEPHLDSPRGRGAQPDHEVPVAVPADARREGQRGHHRGDGTVGVSPPPPGRRESVTAILGAFVPICAARRRRVRRAPLASAR